jgi:AcrR family transcriptional regulator
MTTVSARMKWMAAGGDPPGRKRSLRDAALEEFSSLFRDASLNAFYARPACRGSFYYRFYDKLDLYLSLLYAIGMEKLSLFRRHDSANPSGGFFDECREKAALGMRFARREPRYYAFWRRIMEEESGVKDAITACVGRLTNDTSSEMVDRARAAGELRCDVSAHTAALFVSVLMTRLDLFAPPGADDTALLEALGELLSILRYGLSSRRRNFRRAGFCRAEAENA